MESEKIKKYLIIRLSSLGDILLTYPLIKIIHENEKNIKVDFILKEKFVNAIKTNPFIDHIYSYNEKNKKEIRTQIFSKKYDLIIDLQNNLRSKMLYNFNLTKKFKVKKFKKPTLKKFLLVNLKWNLLKNNKSIALKYIQTYSPTFAENKIPLYFHINDGIINNARSIIGNIASKKIIGICPGAKHYTKRYPTELWKIVIEDLLFKGFSVILLGGTEDKQICEQLNFNNKFFKNLCNDNDLLLTAALMKHCSAVITNDSALSHLSSLLQVPAVVIFGSTVKEFGFAPLFEKSVIVENNSLNCRPCSHIGKSNCPQKHLKCLKDINPQEIIDKLEGILKNG